MHSAQAALQLTQTVVSTSAAVISAVATSLVLPAAQELEQVATPLAGAAGANLPMAHLVQLAAVVGARHSAQVASQSAVQAVALAGLLALVVVPATAVPAAAPFPAPHLVQVPVLAEV